MPEVVFPEAQWWIALLQIIGIDILLSGDNALVIALACRRLPPRQRRLGIWLGTLAAVVLRVACATATAYLMMVPLLKAVGGLLLLWIAIKLLVPEEQQEARGDGSGDDGSLWDAIKIIVIADAVMSFDNVIGVAAAAKGSVVLLALGIAIAIPLMVIGSRTMLWLIDRAPVLIVLGSGLLGWIAGELLLLDPLVAELLGDQVAGFRYVFAAGFALFVVAVGLLLRRRVRARSAVSP